MVLAATAMVAICQTRLTDWQTIASKNCVVGILHDEKNLYVSSNGGGLTKIDKQTCKQRSLNRGNQLCHDNYIMDMTLHNGELWLAGNRYGLGKISDDESTRISLDLSSTQYMSGIHFIDDNTMLLGGLNSFYRIDNGRTTYEYSFNVLSPMCNVTDIKKTDDGKIYVSVFDWCISPSFFIYDGQELKAIEHDYRNIVRMCTVGNTVWLATYCDGLVKYENGAFTQYSTANSDIPSDFLIDICKGENGEVWFTNYKHLVCFANNQFSSYTLPEGCSADHFKSVDVDGSDIYAGTGNNGLFKLEGNTFHKIELVDNYFVNNFVNMGQNPSSGTSAVKADGTFLLTGASGLYSYNPETNTSDIIPCSNLRDVCVSPVNDDVWMFFYDPYWKEEPYLQKLGQEPIRYSQITTPIGQLLGFDSHGNLWATTADGLSKFDGAEWTAFDQSDAGFDISEITCMHFDSRGRLWAGSFGNGLIMFDGSNWHNYKTNNSGLPSDYVGTLAVDKEDVIWLNGRDAWKPFADCGGTGLTRFDGTSWRTYNISNSPIVSNNFYSIEVDADNVKWLATCGDTGLTSFDGNNNWKVYDTDNSGIGYNSVFNITIDPKRDTMFLTHWSEQGASYAKIITSNSGIESPEGEDVAFVNTTVDVYNLQGVRVLSNWLNDGRSLPLHPGIYILCSPNGIKKIAIQ